jgi:hypothetical protein
LVDAGVLTMKEVERKRDMGPGSGNYNNADEPRAVDLEPEVEAVSQQKWTHRPNGWVVCFAHVA